MSFKSTTIALAGLAMTAATVGTVVAQSPVSEGEY